MGQIPPLAALRAFEAAARRESFNAAAAELHVTASAVSHQIRALEELLGVALFLRRTRRVTLTAEGRRYLGPVQEALERLRAATEQLRRGATPPPLVISAAPSFAAGWLIQRLPAFQVANPQQEVRLTTSVELVDFALSDVDVAIRYTRETPGDRLARHWLMREEMVPVCSPALAAGEPALKEPADLGGVTLIHSLPRLGQWRSWLSAKGVAGVDPDRGLKVQDDTLAVEAAAQGLGVALANARFVDVQVAAGRLVMPFPGDLPSDWGFYLVYPRERRDEQRVAAFRDWLLAAAAEDTGPPAAG